MGSGYPVGIINTSVFPLLWGQLVGSWGINNVHSGGANNHCDHNSGAQYGAGDVHNLCGDDHTHDMRERLLSRQQLIVHSAGERWMLQWA